MQSENGQRFYHPELDGLRFIAFLLVFIHNVPIITSNHLLNTLHEYGWIGVDLFFCLSGFLITKLLIIESQKFNEINIRNFYVRRILRIWPLYFLYTAIAIYYILQIVGWDTTLFKHISGIATFTYNFVYLTLTYKTYAVLFHLWTISYEEQFYAIIPLILRASKNISKRNAWVYLITIIILGNCIRAFLIYFRVSHPVIYMLPFTHFEAMLGGIAIGFGLFDSFSSKTKGWILLLFGLISNAIVFFLPNTYEIGWSLMLTYPLVGIGMTLIILSILRNENNSITKILRNKILVYLGKISFGLYTFHLLCISITDQFIRNILGVGLENQTTMNWFLIFAGLITTIVISIASYILFETPFLKLRERFSSIKSRPI